MTTTRNPMLRLGLDELIVDNFAGGGGASCGIEMALGRSPDIAINHDPEAISLHMANHPNTRHLCESVWAVDPMKATAGRPVGLAWFSPDCKHFSKAKGGRPVSKKIRGLAWVVIRWAAQVKPRVIILENVEEFKTWGPLKRNGKPDKARAEAFCESAAAHMLTPGEAFINHRDMEKLRAWQASRCEAPSPQTTIGQAQESADRAAFRAGGGE